MQYGAAVAVDAPAKENAIARTKVATTVTVRLCDDLVRTLRCASPAGGFAEMLIKVLLLDINVERYRGSALSSTPGISIGRTPIPTLPGHDPGALPAQWVSASVDMDRL